MASTKIINIRTFPTQDGDTTTSVAVEALTQEQVFQPGFMVAIGETVCADWDQVLEEIQKVKADEVEITRFRTMAGG